jgi:uncharacterized protein (DUF433 family)
MQSRSEYLDRIVVDPAILVGKPIVRGTRISVELVLAHLAENPDVTELFEAFPHLTIDDVKACLAYAEAVLEGEDVYPATVSGAPTS